ncbi:MULTISPECIES: DNA primase family protein [Stenotrophomonas]|uniref:Phage/plasmid primase, P4 family n=1 Tax=Stenotrophomonas nematodicola TaxID=2656746 RepID=A0ABW7CW95_9GAMM
MKSKANTGAVKRGEANGDAVDQAPKKKGKAYRADANPNGATDDLGIVGEDLSFELAYADDLRRGNQFRIGGKMDNGEIDISLYQWNEAEGIWALQATREVEAHALDWMRMHAPEDAKQSTAASCVKTAILEMIRLPGMKLPESQHRAIVPLKGGYLEILKDANKKAYIEYLPADPKHGITSLVPAKLNLDQVRDGRYTPKPLDPKSRWAKYLVRFMPDMAVRGLLQEAMASSVMPMCLEKAFLLLGSGSNGKSTLLHVLRAIHPKNTAVRIDKLDGQFAMAPLASKTLYLATEAPKVLSDAIQQVMKALISRDPMSAENKGKDAYTTVPRGTLFLALNAMFSVTSHEHGFWRKICMIPFNVRLAENDKDRDPDFHKKLTEDPAEMAVIIDWLLEGALRLIERGGLPEEMPEAVKALAEQTRQETDTTASYFAERMVIEEEGTWTDKNDIYDDYRNYVLDELGRKPVGAEELWKRVRERMPGIQQKQKKATKSAKAERWVNLRVGGLKPRMESARGQGAADEDVPLGDCARPCKEALEAIELLSDGRLAEAA